MTFKPGKRLYAGSMTLCVQAFSCLNRKKGFEPVCSERVFVQLL